MGRKKKVEEKDKDYKFDLHEEVIYLGSLYPDHKDKPCKIINRSKVKKEFEWYRIQFSDNTNILTPLNTIRKKD